MELNIAQKPLVFIVTDVSEIHQGLDLLHK